MVPKPRIHIYVRKGPLQVDTSWPLFHWHCTTPSNCRRTPFRCARATYLVPEATRTQSPHSPGNLPAPWFARRACRMTFLAVSKAARRSFRLPDGSRNLLVRGKNDVLVSLFRPPGGNSSGRPSPLSGQALQFQEPSDLDAAGTYRSNLSRRVANVVAFSATMCNYSFVWYTGDSG